MHTARPRLVALVLVLSCAIAAPVTGEVFISGLEPDRRPAGAPSLNEYVKDAAWYCQALTGVSSPYPASLRFLEDQGAWHTPFVRPGMTGPYDLRHWHATACGGVSRTVPGR